MVFHTFVVSYCFPLMKKNKAKVRKTMCFHSQSCFFFRFFRFLISSKMMQKCQKPCVLQYKINIFSVFSVFSDFPRKKNLWEAEPSQAASEPAGQIPASSPDSRPAKPGVNLINFPEALRQRWVSLSLVL